MILHYLTTFIILGKCGGLVGELPEVRDDEIIFEKEYKEILSRKTEGDNKKSNSATPEYFFVSGQYIREHPKKTLDKGGMPSAIHRKTDSEIRETSLGWTNSYKSYGFLQSLRSLNDSQGNQSNDGDDPPKQNEQIFDKMFSAEDVLAIAHATEFVGVRPISDKGREKKDDRWYWNRKRETRERRSAQGPTTLARQKRSKFHQHHLRDDSIYFPDYKHRPFKVTTTKKPVVRPTSSVNVDMCVRSCLTTPEYNPICGDDGQTYFNPGKLKCTSFCGKKVAAHHFGTCKPVIPPSLVQGVFNN